MDKRKRIRELVDILNEASRVYYEGKDELISNYEYDRLYDELSELEDETGYILSSSPTNNVGYEVAKELPKYTHETPMLSLDKTKSREDLSSWLGDKEGILSLKLDGLTIVLTYENGKMIRAVTRGNGIVGEIITDNAKAFMNIPINIPYKGELILRGEALIKYSDFEEINDGIENAAEKFKNPRNLCSGSVRQLDPAITKKRKVCFYAFSLVKASGIDFDNSHWDEMQFLSDQGFDVVFHTMVNGKNIVGEIAEFEKIIQNLDLPSDGLVLMYDDILYGQSLGNTAKFPRNAIAFKWQDSIKETTLKEIIWSPSRTGLINPIAVFEPVELENTTVSRALLHNLSIVKSLKLGVGDKITVYKANMIIPQIADNLTKSNTCIPPCNCPVCGSKTSIKGEGGVEAVYCDNPECKVKHIKLFSHAVTRDALNISGLSEATLEKLVGISCIKEIADIYKLHNFKNDILDIRGFKDKSYDNLISSIEKSRNTTPQRVLYCLGITGVGGSMANNIMNHFNGNFDKLINASVDELMNINGIGKIIASDVYNYFRNSDNIKQLNNLLNELVIEKTEIKSDSGISGKVIAITGSLEKFNNRKELEELIRENGATPTSSVGKNTDFLINNDINSGSSKNKKAKSLGIPIISEDEFLKLI